MEQRDLLRQALWRDPLNQRLVNLLYVDAMRTASGGKASTSSALALSRLGWRYTPAQQNLMLRAAMDGRFKEVADRADGLLRRQQLIDQAMTMLALMEALPPIHGLVVNKLLDRPGWRGDYLPRIGPQAPPPLLEARRQTLQTLLRSSASASRAELVPVLQALVANGRARAAYDLWMLKAGRTQPGNLVRDPRFLVAATSGGEQDLVPFEWQLKQNIGYSVDASQQGLTINWDGHGVPVFMSQLVPVEQGRRYILLVRGRADSGNLGTLLAPTLDCGQVTTAFTAVGASEGTVRFRSDVVPQGCDMAVLAIGGDVDAGPRASSIDIDQIVLQRSE